MTAAEAATAALVYSALAYTEERARKLLASELLRQFPHHQATMTSGAAQDEETSSPTHTTADGGAPSSHIQQHKQGMHYGSGTTSTLAINAFQQRVECNRTRDRRSERSGVSVSRQSSSRNTNVFVAAGGSRPPDPYESSGTAHSQHLSSSLSPPFLRTGSSPGAMDLVQSMINSSPGCYAGDDGSVDISDRYNFFAHGKRFLIRLCVHHASMA